MPIDATGFRGTREHDPPIVYILEVPGNIRALDGILRLLHPLIRPGLRQRRTALLRVVPEGIGVLALVQMDKGRAKHLLPSSRIDIGVLAAIVIGVEQVQQDRALVSCVAGVVLFGGASVEVVVSAPNHPYALFAVVESIDRGLGGRRRPFILGDNVAGGGQVGGIHHLSLRVPNVPGFRNHAVAFIVQADIEHGVINAHGKTHLGDTRFRSSLRFRSDHVKVESGFAGSHDIVDLNIEGEFGGALGDKRKVHGIIAHIMLSKRAAVQIRMQSAPLSSHEDREVATLPWSQERGPVLNQFHNTGIALINTG